MLRFFFSLILYVVVARWIYAELQILSPSLVPLVDSGVRALTIPTHDKWETTVSKLMEQYQELRDQFPERAVSYPQATPFQPYTETPRVRW
jgi:hypothetical protein